MSDESETRLRVYTEAPGFRAFAPDPEEWAGGGERRRAGGGDTLLYDGLGTIISRCLSSYTARYSGVSEPVTYLTSDSPSGTTKCTYHKRSKCYLYKRY